MPERRRRTAVIGVGNVLMGDEGIGVRVVEALGQRGLPPGVELLDGGTAFHALTGELTEFDKLVIVDAVKGGGTPGTVYRFGLEELEKCETVVMAALSLHEVGVLETLKLERLVGQIPDEIVFIGVEPQRIEPSTKLSPVLQKKLPLAVQAVLEELKPRPSASERRYRGQER